MNKVAMKVAFSTAAIGATMMGCSPAGTGYRPTALSFKAPKADQQAAKFYQNAQAALAKGAITDALPLVEKAVELAPRDAGYRLLLADIYLKQGRFLSAETTFGDVLALDSSNTRAALSLALAQIALGKTNEAVAQLDSLAGVAEPSDLGLAYALAGQPQRAIAMLEPLAREHGATAQLRQNLALAYALAGDWQRARSAAEQDVSPADLSARMEQWAAFAEPAHPSTQVSALLGVTPVMDGGQPTQLALAPAAPEAPALAEAAPGAVPEMAIETVAVDESTLAISAPAAQLAPAPIELASLQPIEVAPAGQAAPEQRLAYAEAAEALVTPKAEAKPTVAIASAPIKPFTPPPSKAVAKEFNPGRYVVQIGAFRSSAQVEQGWAEALKRFSFNSAEPFSTTVKIPGKGMFHRLSVAGFNSQIAAVHMCREIRSKRGVCFVRAVAGDAPVQWASRYARKG
jgi:Flp pilus assembly protein TadD